MSFNKVYWKRLILVLREVVRYIQRNQLKLQQNLEPDAYTCVIATLDAALECLAALPENTPIN